MNTNSVHVPANRTNTDITARKATWLKNFFGNSILPEFDTVMQGWGADWLPSIEVSQEGSHYKLLADLPGVAKDDVRVEYSDNTLTIHGERRNEQQKTESHSYRSERYYGTFSRLLTFPGAINRDSIRATLKDGVLEIHLDAPELDDTSVKVQID